MTDRRLRARILLEEARALGVELDDLLDAAHVSAASLPTVQWYLDSIASTFTPATARTYRPYWRLLVAHLGEHRLAEVTTADLTAVVDAAGTRAQIHRPGSTGRASRESCVAALRAVFSRAADASLITGNPAAALIKPRRATSRRRALATPSSPTSSPRFAPPATTPTWTSSWSGSTSSPAPVERVRSTSAAASLTVIGSPSGSARRATANASNPSPPHSSPSSTTTQPIAERPGSMTPPCAPPTAHRCRPAATAPSSTAPAPACPGPNALPSRLTSCPTPPSPLWAASPATPWPKPSPATPHPPSPAAISTPPSTRSPPPSPSSPANPIPWPPTTTDCTLPATAGEANCARLRTGPTCGSTRRRGGTRGYSAH